MPHYYIFHATGPHISTVEARDDAHFLNLLQTAAKGYVYLRIFTDAKNSEYPHIDTCDIPPETRAKTLPQK